MREPVEELGIVPFLHPGLFLDGNLLGNVSFMRYHFPVKEDAADIGCVWFQTQLANCSEVHLTGPGKV